MSTPSSEPKIHAIAALGAKTPLVPFEYQPIPLKPTDVEVAIHVCGVCHADLHQANNDWGKSVYPMVPGHEIIGTVSKVGSAVTEVKLGERVGVPLQISHCGTCPQCVIGDNQLCKQQKWIFNYPTGNDIQLVSFGGFASHVRVDQHWAFPIPSSLPDVAAAPLMCAGITMWAPFIHHSIGPKHRVGIIGVGGLGHLGVQFSVKFGAHTTGISTSDDKKKEVLAYGAQAFLNSNDSKQMAAAACSFDYLLATANAEGINWDSYLDLLAPNGTLSILGAPSKITFTPFKTIISRLTITGSPMASNSQIREMLTFCAKNNVVAATEERPMTPAGVNESFAKVAANTARYRMVLVAPSPQSTAVDTRPL